MSAKVFRIIIIIPHTPSRFTYSITLFFLYTTVVKRRPLITRLTSLIMHKGLHHHRTQFYQYCRDKSLYAFGCFFLSDLIVYSERVFISSGCLAAYYHHLHPPPSMAEAVLAASAVVAVQGSCLGIKIAVAAAVAGTAVVASSIAAAGAAGVVVVSDLKTPKQVAAVPATTSPSQHSSASDAVAVGAGTAIDSYPGPWPASCHVPLQ